MLFSYHLDFIHPITNKKIDITLPLNDDFIKNLSFSYDEKSIVSVMNKFNLSFEVAKTMLDNIKYLMSLKTVDKNIFEKGIKILDLTVDSAPIFNSKGEIRNVFQKSLVFGEKKW